MITLFVLDVPENAGIVKAVAQDPLLRMDHVGPYLRITAERGAILIDRRATGCRHAVWYSAVAGIGGGMVTQLDKDALKVEANP